MVLPIAVTPSGLDKYLSRMGRVRTSQRRVVHVAFWDIILSRVKEFGPDDTVNYIKQERRKLDSILAGLSRGDKRRFTENLRDSSVVAALQHIQRRSAPDGVGGGARGDDSFSEAPYERPASPLTDERDDLLKANEGKLSSEEFAAKVTTGSEVPAPARVTRRVSFAGDGDEGSDGGGDIGIVGIVGPGEAADAADRGEVEPISETGLAAAADSDNLRAAVGDGDICGLDGGGANRKRKLREIDM
jgi:hypothetical protein